MKSSKEKILLIRILEDKIFIANASKHSKKFKLSIQGNIQTCLKDSLNINMKLFIGGLAPVTQADTDFQLPFKFCFAKNGMLKLSPGFIT